MSITVAELLKDKARQSVGGILFSVTPAALFNLSVTNLPAGFTYNWTVTCYSPQNTSTTASASG